MSHDLNQRSETVQLKEDENAFLLPLSKRDAHALLWTTGLGEGVVVDKKVHGEMAARLAKLRQKLLALLG